MVNITEPWLNLMSKERKWLLHAFFNRNKDTFLKFHCFVYFSIPIEH